MENGLWYNTLGCCDQYQECPQDADDLLFLLIAFIMLVNIGINLATVIWHRVQSALDKIINWINQINKILQACESFRKDAPAKAQDVHIHCTLDPVEVKTAWPTCCSSASHRHLCKRSRHLPRRNHLRSLCIHRWSPKNHRPFPNKKSQRRPGPSFDQKDLDPFLEEEEENLPFPNPNCPPWDWGGLYQQIELPSNMGLWGLQGGILATLPPPSLYLSPKLRRMPKRVEAKSELRLQSCGPRGSQSHIRGNREAERWTLSLAPPHQLPPNPSWAPGGHSLYQSRGQPLYESRDQRRCGLERSEPPSALVPRSSRPEAQEHYIPQPHWQNTPGHAHSLPKRCPHPSTGYLSHTFQDPRGIQLQAAEWAEVSPTQHPLTTSTSLTMLGEVSYKQTLAPSSTLFPHSSQALSEVQATEPPESPPTFVPLSRSPGGNANYQVYDSLELKRQVRESRMRANSLLPPCSSASKTSLYRSRTGKSN